VAEAADVGAAADPAWPTWGLTAVLCVATIWPAGRPGVPDLAEAFLCTVATAPGHASFECGNRGDVDRGGGEGGGRLRMSLMWPDTRLSRRPTKT
jgi:hypothetical protein